jgi:hypothetical protein
MYSQILFNHLIVFTESDNVVIDSSILAHLNKHELLAICISVLVNSSSLLAICIISHASFTGA